MELLSPVGSPEALRAAVLCGADAVYLGAPIFNARSSAKNFDFDNLHQSVAYAHQRGVKVFLTLNTLVSDREVPQFLDVVKLANQIGIDAAIVQDIGMAALIKAAAPKLPVHASTQMSIHNLDGVLAAARLGIDRVILARELDAQNIAYICKNSPIEIEVFVHGALCMSYSGQCLMSAMIAQRSGNRGKCGQPCRLQYAYKDQEPFPLLSLKDLCLLDHIKELKEAGVTSLKVEGRLKRPEYVGLVTATYKKIMRTGQLPTQDDYEKLQTMFSRKGFTAGYFTNTLGGEMFGVHVPNEEKKEYQDLCKHVQTFYRQEYELQRVGVSFAFLAAAGQESLLVARDEDKNIVYAHGEQPQIARQRELDTDVVKAQLEKTNSTQYFVEAMEIQIGQGLALPLSAINAMRREVLLKLDEKRACPPQREFDMPTLLLKSKPFARHPDFCVSIDKISQLADNILDARPDYIYVPLQSIRDKKTELSYFVTQGQNISVKMPRVYFDSQKQDIVDMLREAQSIGIAQALCTNLGQAELLKSMGLLYRGDFSLNIFNSYSLKTLVKLGFKGAMLSYELLLQQIRDMRKNIDTELLVYGRQELMLCQNCIVKNSRTDCNQCKVPQHIKDRRGEEFLIRGEYGCRNTILNSHTLYLLDKLYDFDKLGVSHLRLNFTDEDRATCAKLFDNAINCAPDKPKNFTRGLYYKGVK